MKLTWLTILVDRWNSCWWQRSWAKSRTGMGDLDKHNIKFKKCSLHHENFFWGHLWFTFVLKLAMKQKTLFLKIELNSFSNRGHIYSHFEKKKIQISQIYEMVRKISQFIRYHCFEIWALKVLASVFIATTWSIMG